MENEGLPVRPEECHQAGRDAGQEQTDAPQILVYIAHEGLRAWQVIKF